MTIDKRRGLLIAWHYPPDAAVGALRWQKSVRDLAEYGWQFDVVTAPVSAYAATDPEGMNDVPTTTEVMRVDPRDTVEDHLLRLYRYSAPLRRPSGNGRPPVPARIDGTDSAFIHPEDIRFQPTRLNDWKRSMLSALHWPDGGRGWLVPATQCGIAAATRRRYDVVVSSGPPHITHMVARRIGRAHHIPHVVDFRDPWTARPMFHSQATPTSVWLDRQFERRVVREAALVLTTTPGLAERYRRDYRLAVDRVVCLPNGGDLENVPAGVPKHRRFTIVYAGSLYLGRSPRNVFAAVGRLRASGRVGADDIAIRLIGDCELSDGVSVRDMAHTAGVADMVEFVGNVSRRQAAEELAAAHVVLVLAQQQDLMVPHKLYEALVTPGAWVLAVAPPDTATSHVLRAADGVSVAPDDVDGAADAIAKWVDAVKAGRRADDRDVVRFARSARSRELAHLLNGVAEESRAGVPG